MLEAIESLGSVDGAAASGPIARRRPADPIRDGSRLTVQMADSLFDAQLAEPPSRPRRPLAARQGARLLHDRLGRPRGQRGGGRRAPPHRSRRCCTTGRAASTSLAPRRFARPASSAPGTCWPGCWRSPRNRSPAAATRCSGIPSSTSSRRRRPSPRTCRARSVSRSRSTGPGALGLPTRLVRRRDRRLLVRRRQRQPLHRPGCAEHRRLHARTTASRCRCCSCARTTAGASASRRPSGWVGGHARAPSGHPLRERRRQRSRRCLRHGAASSSTGCATQRRPAVLHLRTVRYLGHAGTDVESGYRSASSIARRPRARPAARHGPAAGRRRRRHARRAGRPLPRRPARRSAPSRSSSSTRRTLETRGRGDGAAVAPSAHERRVPVAVGRVDGRSPCVLRGQAARGGGRPHPRRERSTARWATCCRRRRTRWCSARTSA